MTKVLGAIGAIIALTGTTVGAIHYFTPRTEFEAQCEEVQGFRKEFDMDRLQRKIWKLEDRYQCTGLQQCQQMMPPHDYHIYRELLGELERLIGG